MNNSFLSVRLNAFLLFLLICCGRGGAQGTGGRQVPETGAIRWEETLPEPVGPFLDGVVKPYYKHRRDGQAGREVTLHLRGGRFQGKAEVIVECEGKRETTEWKLDQPADSLSVLLPAGAGVTRESQARIVVRNGRKTYYETLVIPAKRQWTVYIYPHSHVDVGYTNLQDVVEKLHVRNIDVGIDIARKTKDYPVGARFVWNPEATWVVDSYLRNASAEQKRSFVEAVRKGWIQIDAAHSNINTTVCSDEELLRLFRNTHEIKKLTGVPVPTMVQVDLPGAAWGIVQAAAQNGVRGYFSFPNWYDRRHIWEHKPFYWVSADKKYRMFFLQGSPYGYGYQAKGSKYGLAKTQTLSPEYDRVSTDKPLENFIDPFIFRETAKLEREHSPYDIFAMTWSMADNCLIDADLPEAVKQWNEIYAYPKLIIAGTREIMEAYEKKYGSIIPEYTGDFTEYWTEGLGSDARRVGMVRRAKENLVQAETLWALLNKKAEIPIAAFNAAWENVLLAAEHTWGYQNPRAPLAKNVEANKAAYFENAEKESKELIAKAMGPLVKQGASTFAVINTLSWSRDGLVTLSAEQSRKGNRVVDEENREVPAQRLSTGDLVFQTGLIPALGSRLYHVVPGNTTLPGELAVDGVSLHNDLISVTLDTTTGAIKSLVDRKTGRQLADTTSPFQLNSFYYLPGVNNGRDSVRAATGVRDVRIEIRERGPLVVSLLVHAQADGCHWLTREVRLVKGKPMIELVNTMDKKGGRQKEGLHFGFAFHVPGGTTRMDVPWAVMQPEVDQLPGANRNWLAVQRWIDISNEDYGITWTAIETPIVQLGGMTGTILDGARQAWLWVKKIPVNQTIVSWATNNHWDTNFPLEQRGVIRSQYQVLLHGTYDPVVANRFGVEQNRPLIAVETSVNPLKAAPVAIDNPAVMISTLKRSEDNKALILRLRSISDKKEKVVLSWPGGKPATLFRCLPDEQPLERSKENLEMEPYGNLTLRIVFPDRK